MKLLRGNSHPAGDAPRDAIAVRVTDAGYEPDTIRLPAGRPAKIAFTRETGSPCAAAVTFPDLGVHAALPFGEDVVVELPPPEAGEHAFTCEMGMLRGTLVAAEEESSHSGAHDACCHDAQGDPR